LRLKDTDIDLDIFASLSNRRIAPSKEAFAVATTSSPFAVVDDYLITAQNRQSTVLAVHNLIALCSHIMATLNKGTK
jgi:hypothetical protein